MNEEDIRQFMNAYEDFMKHSETEIDYYQKQKEARQYTKEFYEKKAKEMNVTTEYYLQEFV
jgi:poly-beta-hydroxyalkanoate depolymerase